MEVLKKMKSNRGVTLTDVVVAILIMIIFTTILTSSFYNVYKYNISIRKNAIAVDYAVKILEDIDKMPYEDVTNDLNNTLTQNYNMQENYTASISVTNYNSIYSSKEDIIKIVTVNINYNFDNQTETYAVQKLKIKEM